VFQTQSPDGSTGYAATPQVCSTGLPDPVVYQKNVCKKHTHKCVGPFCNKQVQRLDWIMTMTLLLQPERYDVQRAAWKVLQCVEKCQKIARCWRRCFLKKEISHSWPGSITVSLFPLSITTVCRLQSKALCYAPFLTVSWKEVRVLLHNIAPTSATSLTPLFILFNNQLDFVWYL